VLSNLIGNAIQHGTLGPITVTVCEQTPDAVAIEVHNLGPPIPQAAQAGIFEAFRRETTAKDSRSKSVGLGCSSPTRSCARMEARSLCGHPTENGTTFRVVPSSKTCRRRAEGAGVDTLAAFIDGRVMGKAAALDLKEAIQVGHSTGGGEVAALPTSAKSDESVSFPASKSGGQWPRAGGSDVPLAARILAACDVFRAVAEERPHLPALGRRGRRSP